MRDIVGRTVALQRCDQRRPLHLREVTQLLDKRLELLCLHELPLLANHQQQDRSTSWPNRALASHHEFVRDIDWAANDLLSTELQLGRLREELAKMLLRAYEESGNGICLDFLLSLLGQEVRHGQ